VILHPPTRSQGGGKTSEKQHTHSLSLSVSEALEKSRPTFTRLHELVYRSALSLELKELNDRVG